MTEPNQTHRGPILEKIIVIIREVLPHATESITTTTAAADVEGWDSIAHVQIIHRVERGFAIRIRSTEIARLDNVGALVDLVLARGSTAGGS